MLDAQRRSAERDYKRVTPEISTQTRPVAESIPTCRQDASDCDEPICTCPEEISLPASDSCGCADQCVPAKPGGLNALPSEELLIMALLLLTLSEGGNLPLVLVLLYLLM